MTILCVTILSLGERGIRVLVGSMAEASASKSFEISGSSVQHREAMTTWGILALAVFVPVGMAEWSKRQAASETVIDSVVMEEALNIAVAAASKVNVKVNANGNESGMRKAEMGLGIEDWGLRGEENFNGKAPTKAFVEPITGPDRILPKGDVNDATQ